jgi:hypothetical protein
MVAQTDRKRSPSRRSLPALRNALSTGAKLPPVGPMAVAASRIRRGVTSFLTRKRELNASVRVAPEPTVQAQEKLEGVGDTDHARERLFDYSRNHPLSAEAKPSRPDSEPRHVSARPRRRSTIEINDEENEGGQERQHKPERRRSERLANARTADRQRERAPRVDNNALGQMLL